MKRPHPTHRGATRATILTILTAVAIGLIAVAGQLRPEGDPGSFDVAAFARLPVTAEGRVKPFDTVARNALLAISGRQSARVEGETLSATQWLLDAINRAAEADAYEVFRVDHPDVKALIMAGGGDDERKRFSWNEIAKNGPEIEKQASLATSTDEARRNPYQRHLLELWSHLLLYRDVQANHHPLAVPPFAEGEQWQSLSQALHAGHTGETGGAMSPAATALSGIFTAYQQRDARAFNARVADYAETLRSSMPRDTSRAAFETRFNFFAPFYQGTVLYVLAGLVGFAALLFAGREDATWFERFRVAAVTLLVLAFVVHTFGIAGRVYIQGRPPVTNLYSSAVFIGWVATLVGLFIEWAFRNTLGTIVAAMIGVATLIVAHNLADGDTLQMMQAVLDSNFWLATHVIIITVGYGAMFLAGAFGTVYLLTGVYSTALTPARAKVLTKVIYGTIAFALLFSFVGTVLGGIWADQSWGRFWGWDPKENGAILIVLWAAMILHARWGGMVAHRGVAVLAVGGNIVTAWSWFGTNMLGVGLHSYGFMDSAMFWLLAYAVSQLAIMAVGCLPMRRWASFEAPAPAAGRRGPLPLPPGEGGGIAAG